MIFRVAIGEIACLMDDEMDERPTPEHARDYLKVCGDEVLRVYAGLDVEADAEATTEETT
jgi:hypothetical protein